MSNKHVLHLENGKFASASGLEELQDWFIKASSLSNEAGWVFHFHGGLVSEQYGRGIAAKLNPQYKAAGAYPLFFVWESGLLEVIQNNAHEIFKEQLLKETVKKVGEWVAKKLPSSLGLKGKGNTLVNSNELVKELDDWLYEKPPTDKSKPPELKIVENTPKTNKSALFVQDDASISAEIVVSIQQDPQFIEAYTAVYNGLHKPTLNSKAKGTGSSVSEQSEISMEAADQLFDLTPYGTKGVLSWYKVAKFIAKLVVSVVKRIISERDHGIYITVVEEVLRSLYADKLGKFIWDTMKQDTADAFKEDMHCGGYALIKMLKAKMDNDGSLPVITLVGHSTGAIYIRHFIESATKQIDNIKFNIIFLAAAETYKNFAPFVQAHKQSITNFRSFAMTDNWEKADTLVPVLYPASLLYFISGVLEDEIDKPLIGMQRYYSEPLFQNSTTFSDITTVKAFMDNVQSSLVWSPIDSIDGNRSNSASHGDFDDDPLTVSSIKHILMSGYL